MAERKRETWTAEELATLRLMAKEGQPMIEIARALKKSLAAVLGKATQLKIKVVR